MKFLIVLVALAAIVLAENQLDNQNIINSRAEDIAKWAATRLQHYTNLNGDHKFVKVSNVKTELLQDKIQFQLAIDVAVVGDAKTAVVKTCQITVLESPWTNSRVLDDRVSCVDNATY